MSKVIPNILFVCARNKWRSPTAEKIYQKSAKVHVRSAGVSKSARHKVNKNDLHWADCIIFMEAKYRARLLAENPDALRHKDVRVLGVEDNYQFMDDELIEILRDMIDPIINEIT